MPKEIKDLKQFMELLAEDKDSGKKQGEAKKP